MQILTNVIQQLQIQNLQWIIKYRQKCECMSIQVFLTPVARNSVDLVYDLINSPQFQQERMAFKNHPDDIHVIIESGGGDADAAYHIAKLLDAHFKGTIKYIVPRFAKSAATLLVCGGNKIVMGETSELGPLDPQILQNDGSYISAKAVESTLELIKKYLSEGEHGLELATILSSRLNPLILGQYESTLKIAQEYQEELLHLRMFNKSEDVKKISAKFATGYTHHSRVINCKEAKEIFGDDKVEVMKSDSEEWQAVWQISKNNRTMADLIGVLQLINKLNPQTNR